MAIVENKYVATALDGNHRPIYSCFLFRAGCEPSKEFARFILSLFVRKKFMVAIRQATTQDLADFEMSKKLENKNA